MIADVKLWIIAVFAYEIQKAKAFSFSNGFSNKSTLYSIHSYTEISQCEKLNSKVQSGIFGTIWLGKLTWTEITVK